MRDVLLQNARENRFADGGDGNHRNCGHAVRRLAEVVEDDVFRLDIDVGNRPVADERLDRLVLPIASTTARCTSEFRK